jgi:hypothetical protein
VFLGREDLELKTRPYAGLIKAGEEAMAEKWLQVREDVGLLIFWIFVVVQACAVSNIRIRKVKLNRIHTADQRGLRNDDTMLGEFDEL